MDTGRDPPTDPSARRLIAARLRGPLEQHSESRSMPRITLTLPAEQVTALRTHLAQAIDEARQRLVHDVARTVCREIADTVPVDTGETRNAWLAAADRLAAAPPESTESVSTQTIGVQVDQMLYVEYGTTRIAARAPARRALQSVTLDLGTLFRITAN